MAVESSSDDTVKLPRIIDPNVDSKLIIVVSILAAALLVVVIILAIALSRAKRKLGFMLRKDSMRVRSVYSKCQLDFSSLGNITDQGKNVDKTSNPYKDPIVFSELEDHIKRGSIDNLYEASTKANDYSTFSYIEAKKDAVFTNEGFEGEYVEIDLEVGNGNLKTGHNEREISEL